MIELRELCGQFDAAKVVTATHYNEKYFAVGTKIYKQTDSLREWVDTGMDCTAVTINGSGSLIAASSGSKIKVYTQHAKLLWQETVKTGVLKVIWHPLGLDDACLCVLSRGVLFNFWLSSKGLLADKYEFTKNGGFGAQEGPETSISMSFGTDATGKFTLFLQTDEGLLFALSPFLPPEFQLTRAVFSRLVDYAATAHHNHPSIRSQQLEWIKAIELQMESAIPKETDQDTFYALKTPDFSVCCQGPFKLNPYPEQLYEAEFYDLAAFSYNGLHFLVQAASNTLVFLLIDEPVPLYWVSSQLARDVDLAVVQVVKFEGQKTVLQITCNLVWAHGISNTFLFEPQWILDLEKSLENNTALVLTRTTITKLPPSVISAYTLAAQQASIANFEQSSTYRYLTAKAPPQSLEIEAFSHAQSESVCQDISSLVSGVQVAPISMSGPVTDGVKSLESLDNVSLAYNKEIVKLYKSIVLAFDALRLQSMELHHQLQALNEFDPKLDDVDRNELLAQAQARQDKIKARVAAIDKKTQSIARSVPVGRLEKRWFSELRSLGQKVDDLTQREQFLRQSVDHLPDGEPGESQDLTQALSKLHLLDKDIKHLKAKLHIQA